MCFDSLFAWCRPDSSFSSWFQEWAIVTIWYSILFAITSWVLFLISKLARFDILFGCIASKFVIVISSWRTLCSMGMQFLGSKFVILDIQRWAFFQKSCEFTCTVFRISFLFIWVLTKDQWCFCSQHCCTHSLNQLWEHLLTLPLKFCPKNSMMARYDQSSPPECVLITIYDQKVRNNVLQ